LNSKSGSSLQFVVKGWGGGVEAKNSGLD